MVINKRTGRALVRAGTAEYNGVVINNVDGVDRRYAIITRSDNQRTDHYPLRDNEDR
jgi:hypothetical protein